MCSLKASPLAEPAGTTDNSTVLPPEHWEQAAAEFTGADDDSALGDCQSSTASLSSSILKYRTLAGRTFHSERGNAQYWATNDDRQNQLMDINYHAQTLAIGGKLFLAPLKTDLAVVYDIGTGTGIWAMDFADEHPNTRVIGTDISPIQPGWVPPNVEFQMEDCTQAWTLKENSADYVHIRFMVGSIADWDALFREAYRCLKPGGYLETMEPSAYVQSDDGSVDDKSALSQWGRIFVEGGKKLGRTFSVYEDQVQHKAMKAAGFVDIDEFSYKCPIGGWPEDPVQKEIGLYVQAGLEQDMEGLILFFTNVLQGWTREEIQVYISLMRREMRARQRHGWYWQRAVWGKKPEGATG